MIFNQQILPSWHSYTTSTLLPCYCIVHLDVVFHFLWFFWGALSEWTRICADFLIVCLCVTIGDPVIRRVWLGINKPHLCACPKLGPEFSTLYVLVVFSELWCLSQVTDKPDPIMLYRLHLAMSAILKSYILSIIKYWLHKIDTVTSAISWHEIVMKPIKINNGNMSNDVTCIKTCEVILTDKEVKLKG